MLQNPKKYSDVIICKKKKISKFYVKSAMLLDNAYSKTCVSIGKRLKLYRKGLYDIFYNPLLIAYVESFSDISFPRLTALHQRIYFFHLTIILYLSIGIGRCSHSCR